MRVGDTPEKILEIGRVPREPFRDVLIALMKAHNFQSEPGPRNGREINQDKLEGPLPLRQVAELAGVDHRKLSDLLNDRYDSYDFDFCDRMLCIVGDPHEIWRTEALRWVYDALNLVKLDVDEAVREAVASVEAL